MSDRDDRIREFAYFLWLEEGCPEGQAERHWSAAEALLASNEFERKEIEASLPAIRRTIPRSLLAFRAHRGSFGDQAARLSDEPLASQDRCARNSVDDR
jgi:Protein of unknown function (DUF2934)